MRRSKIRRRASNANTVGGDDTHRVIARVAYHASEATKTARLDPKYEKMVDASMRKNPLADPDRLLRKMKPLQFGNGLTFDGEAHLDDDERIEIETRLVFQEDTIAKLNDALVDQQRQLDQMRDTLARLIELVERREEPEEFKVEQERPPHY